MIDIPVALVALDEQGVALCRKLGSHVSQGVIYGPPGSDIEIGDTAQRLRQLFAEKTPIVGVCAAGILIRTLAPVLADKTEEPPVVAISHDGASVVPLLGGHRGANALAAAIAEHLGGHAAVTTASETSLGAALDDPPTGWKPGNPQTAKAVSAALISGAPVGLLVEAGDTDWLADMPFLETGTHTVICTDRDVAGSATDLVLHPPTLAVGVGCARGCPPEELSALVQKTLTRAGYAAKSVAAIFSIDVKMDEPAVHALADTLIVPARFFDAATLEEQTPNLANPSDLVFAEVGCHGVAEGAALAACGDRGTLVVPKQKSKNATCAVARCDGDLMPRRIGRARGVLHVLGIGPGSAGWRTPAASLALARSTHVVGYDLYLDLLGPALDGKTRHRSPLTKEEERVRLALDLAAEGQIVSLVCSGDAGIYALASLVYELMETDDKPQWNRLEITVEPGISAIQAAAARAGAPINHDFCAISLSDLLTPWEDIERRLQSAASGDFVVALYNPVSERRQEQIKRARDILLTARAPDTPVVVARNLGRAEESLTVIELDSLTADVADMLTLVIVGSTKTRLFRGAVFTPRGYSTRTFPGKMSSSDV